MICQLDHSQSDSSELWLLHIGHRLHQLLLDFDWLVVCKSTADLHHLITGLTCLSRAHSRMLKSSMTSRNGSAHREARSR